MLEESLFYIEDESRLSFWWCWVEAKFLASAGLHGLGRLWAGWASFSGHLWPVSVIPLLPSCILHLSFITLCFAPHRPFKNNSPNSKLSLEALSYLQSLLRSQTHPTCSLAWPVCNPPLHCTIQPKPFRRLDSPSAWRQSNHQQQTIETAPSQSMARSLC